MFLVTRIHQIISVLTALTAIVLAIRELKHAVKEFKKEPETDLTKLKSAN